MDKTHSSQDMTLSMKNLQIDQEGDVTLQLADNSEVQVSSKVLSLASPVFKAMFSSKFAEGSRLKQGGSCRVHLPDDSPEAIKLLCMILYHRSTVLKVEVGDQLLDDMTILWDKGLLETAPMDRLLFPAIVFDEPEYFQLITKCMLYTATKTGFDVTNPRPVHIKAMLPEGLHLTLMSIYRKIKKTMLESFDDVIKDLLVKPWPDELGLNQEFSPHAKSDVFELPYHHKRFFSECNSNHISAYMKEMYKQGLRKIGGELNEVSFSQILDKLENCSFPQIPPVRRGSNTCNSCSLNLDACIRKIRLQGQQAFTGLCLDCVNGGNKEKKGGCRIVHPGGPGAWGLKK
ncbi:hypothetical protein MMC18_009492 [Xylographa bjoerkii]|nr:hypothetical protein [Xylographa bjoerkii]